MINMDLMLQNMEQVLIFIMLMKYLNNSLQVQVLIMMMMQTFLPVVSLIEMEKKVNHLADLVDLVVLEWMMMTFLVKDLEVNSEISAVQVLVHSHLLHLVGEERVVYLNLQVL
jgi:hypothetical protein